MATGTRTQTDDNNGDQENRQGNLAVAAAAQCDAAFGQRQNAEGAQPVRQLHFRAAQHDDIAFPHNNVAQPLGHACSGAADRNEIDAMIGVQAGIAGGYADQIGIGSDNAFDRQDIAAWLQRRHGAVLTLLNQSSHGQ